MRTSATNKNRPTPSAPQIVTTTMDHPAKALLKTLAMSLVTAVARKAITPLLVTSVIRSLETNGMLTKPYYTYKSPKHKTPLATMITPLMEILLMMTMLAPLLAAIAGVGHHADREAKHHNDTAATAGPDLKDFN